MIPLLLLAAALTRTCNAQQTSIDGKTYWWHVHGTENGHTQLLSIRYGGETRKALRDCEQFLKHGFPLKKGHK